MDTPKSSGSHSGVPRRLAMNASQYKRFSMGNDIPTISSPLATSSPMVPYIASSADRPQRRPPSHPTRQNFFLGITTLQNATGSVVDIANTNTNNSSLPEQLPTNINNTIRSADLSSLFTTPEEAAFDVRHAELLQLISAQRELMEQSAAAIAFCRKKYPYNGTLQELSSQRILLVSQERLTLFSRKLDELKDQRFASNFTMHLDDIPESVDLETEDGAEDTGTAIGGMSSVGGHQRLTYCLCIDKFVLHLNPSFSMKKIDKDSSYAFIVLCRYSDYIHATNVANVLDIGELRNQKVKIKELIVFDELPPDFCVMVEVFALRIGKRWDHKWQSVWDFATRAFRNIKRTFSSSNDSAELRITGQSSHSKNVPKGASFSASSILMQQPPQICSAFQRCGYLHLNRDSLAVAKEKFYLSDADYPLEGSIEVYARFAASNAPMGPARPDSERNGGDGCTLTLGSVVGIPT